MDGMGGVGRLVVGLNKSTESNQAHQNFEGRGDARLLVAQGEGRGEGGDGFGRAGE